MFLQEVSGCSTYRNHLKPYSEIQRISAPGKISVLCVFCCPAHGLSFCHGRWPTIDGIGVARALLFFYPPCAYLCSFDLIPIQGRRLSYSNPGPKNLSRPWRRAREEPPELRRSSYSQEEWGPWKDEMWSRDAVGCKTDVNIQKRES